MATNSASLIDLAPDRAGARASCAAAIVVDTAISMPKPSSPAAASSSSCTDA